MYEPVHFKPREYRCKCRRCNGDPAGAPLFEPLLKFLDVLRAAHGRPLIITSGWRCRDHNVASGGADRSFHLVGHAADVWAENLPALAGIAGRISALPSYGVTELMFKGNFIHIAIK
jgi:uncharacterized protein YcbK (DUF882 family)